MKTLSENQPITDNSSSKIVASSTVPFEAGCPYIVTAYLLQSMHFVFIVITNELSSKS